MLPDDGRVGICAEQCFDFEAGATRGTAEVRDRPVDRHPAALRRLGRRAGLRLYALRRRRPASAGLPSRPSAPAPPRLAPRAATFQRDRARVLHSYAFRRLADKTQVVVPGEDDFPRTRLTHSLEVAQIGARDRRRAGVRPRHRRRRRAGARHRASAVRAQRRGGARRGAGAVRWLRGQRADAARADPARGEGVAPVRRPGRAATSPAPTLDATCKYPWPRREGSRKFGYYAADAPAFAWMRAGVPAARRCLEAQVMDWADDVAYSVHDVEDGVHSGMIRLGDIDDRGAGAAVHGGRVAVLRPSGSRTGARPGRPARTAHAARPGRLRRERTAAQAAAKRATSELVGRLSGAAIATTQARYGSGPLGRYEADLLVPDQQVAECALLKAVAAHYVMARRGVAERQACQRTLLTELVVGRARGGAAQPWTATSRRPGTRPTATLRGYGW